jgi:hypothetical protein
MARLMLMYPVAYIFVWTLPTAIRIYQASKGISAPFALQTIDKVRIPLLIDAGWQSNYPQVVHRDPRLRRRPYLWCNRAYIVSLAQLTLP